MPLRKSVQQSKAYHKEIQPSAILILKNCEYIFGLFTKRQSRWSQERIKSTCLEPVTEFRYKPSLRRLVSANSSIEAICLIFSLACRIHISPINPAVEILAAHPPSSII